VNVYQPSNKLEEGVVYSERVKTSISEARIIEDRRQPSSNNASVPALPLPPNPYLRKRKAQPSLSITQQTSNSSSNDTIIQRANATQKSYAKPLSAVPNSLSTHSAATSANEESSARRMSLPVVHATSSSVGTHAPNQYYPNQDAPSTTTTTTLQQQQPPRPVTSSANTIERATNSSGSDPPNYAAPIINHYRQQPNHPLSSGALNPPSTKTASHVWSGRPTTTKTASQVVSGRQMPSPVVLKNPYQQSSPRSAINPGVSRETSSGRTIASNQPYHYAAAPINQYRKQQNPALLSASPGSLKPPPATTNKTASHGGSAHQMPPVKNPYQQSSPGRAIVNPGVSGATQTLVSSQPSAVPNPHSRRNNDLQSSQAQSVSSRQTPQRVQQPGPPELRNNDVMMASHNNATLLAKHQARVGNCQMSNAVLKDESSTRRLPPSNNAPRTTKDSQKNHPQQSNGGATFCRMNSTGDGSIASEESEQTITASSVANKAPPGSLASIRPPSWKTAGSSSVTSNCQQVQNSTAAPGIELPGEPHLPKELRYTTDRTKAIKDEYRRTLSNNAILSSELKNGWTLFPHQKRAILMGLMKRRLILALDMGLGKTLIGCVWSKSFQLTYEALKIFVVCPVSLKTEWKRTAENTTDLKVEDENGGAKKSSLDLKICSWAKIPTEVDVAVKNYVVLFDEAHSMQSMQAARTKDALKLVNNKR
jgi:hypothetical protein